MSQERQVDGGALHGGSYVKAKYESLGTSKIQFDYVGEGSTARLGPWRGLERMEMGRICEGPGWLAVVGDYEGGTGGKYAYGDAYK